jgi:hypothetical protein
MKKYITKQSDIKGAGKGLFTNAAFKKGEVIGLAHVDGQPTSVIGKNHNHNEKNPTANNIKNGNKRYLVAAKDLQPGEEITTNYRLQPELEQPEDFEKKKGGNMTPQKDGYRTYSPFKKLPYIDVKSDTIDSDNIVYDLNLEADNGLTKFVGKNTGLHTLPGAKVIREIPAKRKGGLVKQPKKFSRNLMAKNRLFDKNDLFKKKRSVKNKIFDPNSQYYAEGGEYEEAELTPEEIEAYRAEGYIVDDTEYKEGGALLTKKVTCKKCGWTWNAADGGDDMTTCHRCGGQGLIHAQHGGAPIPKGYQATLDQFINPEVIETPYNTAYNTYTGTIGQDSSDPNQTQDWWMEHEKFHHLQNSAGALHSAGPVGLRANPFVDSEQSLNSNDRRKTELNSQIDQMIKADPNLQFIPREKLAQSTYDEDMQEPGFVGAEDLIYADPSTMEGEARAYEQYIRQGGKSVFPKKAKGGEPGDRFKKRLLKRYPGMQGVYGKEGENLNIIKDPNYAASDYGFGNIEFIHPGSGHVQYSDNYDYQSPTPDKYTAVYNPKGANKHDVFLDTMHGMRNDPEYMKLLDKFSSETKKTRGESMDHWYEVDSKKDPYLVEDGREQWDKNFIDGVLRSHLAKKGMGRHSSDVKGYKMERQESTPEMYKATDDIYKYLKGKFKNGGAYYDDSRDAWVSADGTVGPNGPANYQDGGNYIETELTPEEIQTYKDGGYIVEDIKEYSGGGNKKKKVNSVKSNNNYFNPTPKDGTIVSNIIVKPSLKLKTFFDDGGFVNEQLPVAQNGKQTSGTSAFDKKLEQVAKNLQVSKKDLIAIMNHESGLNPAAVNPSSGATGLIQFMPATARGLGTSTAALRKMSATQQLDYVEKYYKNIKGKAKDVGDLYMYTFLPAAVGKPNNFVIGSKGSGSSVFGISQNSLYNQNKVFDKDNKGYYTVGDVKARISKFSGKPVNNKYLNGEDYSGEDYNGGIQPTSKEELALILKNKELEFQQKQMLLAEQERIKHDDDYSNWNPREKEVVVDPKLAQLQAYNKLITPSVQNVNDMFAATRINQQQQQKQFAKGGYIDAELTPEEIQQYAEGGFIVEDISVPSLNQMAEGGQPCLEGQEWDEASQSCVDVAPAPEEAPIPMVTETPVTETPVADPVEPVETIQPETTVKLNDNTVVKAPIVNKIETVKEKVIATSKDDYVLDIQRKLKSAGYNIGSSGTNKDGVDGIMGVKTRSALEAYKAGVLPKDVIKPKPIPGVTPVVKPKPVPKPKPTPIDLSNINWSYVGNKTLGKAYLPEFKEKFRQESCKEGKGCSYNASKKLTSLYSSSTGGDLWAADAWFNKDHIIKDGGDIIYETSERNVNKMRQVPKDMYAYIQVGDYVQLNRPGSEHDYEKDETGAGLKNDRNEHVGFIIGKDKDGVPLVWHGSDKGQAYIQRINEKIYLPDHENIPEYRITSIARTSGLKNQFESYNPNKKIVANKDATPKQHEAIASLNKNAYKFNKLGYNQDDVNYVSQLLIGGIMHMETSGGESYKRLPKEVGARVLKDTLGVAKGEASRGYYQLKPKANFTKDGKLTEQGKRLKALGIDVNSIGKSVGVDTQAGVLYLLDAYKDLRADPKFNVKTNMYDGNIPASYILAKAWNSGSGWQNKREWKDYLKNLDVDYSANALKGTSAVGINKGSKNANSDYKKYVQPTVVEREKQAAALLKQEKLKREEATAIAKSKFYNVNESTGVNKYNPIEKKLPSIDVADKLNPKPKGVTYTFPGQKNAKYKKDASGAWYVNNGGKNGKFVKINDPKGIRTRNLNKSAKPLDVKHAAWYDPRGSFLDPRTYFKDGGFVTDVDDDEIDNYLNNGYIVEEID